MPEADNWFSLFWYYPSTLSGFQWEMQHFFYLLLIIPALFLLRGLLKYFSSQKLTIAFPEKKFKADFSNFLRYIPPLLFTLALINVIMALARPQKSNEKVEQWTEGIDIMLTIDISQSMELRDFEPNRLEAAKEVARDFISGRFQDRIGIVIFSGEAYSLAPLTTDYELLSSYIDDISFDKIEARGTAIGSALAVGINRMRESDSNSKVLILLSDGDNTAGNIDPITAAKLAQAYNIKLYTIAVGKEGKVPFRRGPFGQMTYVEHSLDETTLREIARIGDGQFFRATDNSALAQVFSRIDRYEKAEIKETKYKDTTDYYFVYLKWAVVFFLLWLVSKSTFLNNILQD